MNYPIISEYIEAIKSSEDNFEELKNLRPVLDENDEPVMTSGNFAVVFKMKDVQTGKLHAVKCFLKEQEGRAEAYRMIAEELEYVSSTFLTPIKYLDKELFVDSKNSDETEFPVLLMDWVEGKTLDKYIREHIDDQYVLSLLAYQFSRLAMWLMPQPFAHGDLKPDNILVKDDGTLVLVDYDGMYVPAMKGQKARELGSPDFRHPSRTENDFDEHIDDFSLASILLSLKAISLQPSLLEEYGASDRLLFSEKDYRNLSESNVLGALQPLMQDAELASLYSLYILALSQSNLSQVSFRLFNLARPDKSQYEEDDFSTEVTEEDLINAWTDEYGVMYSRDGKRVLKTTKKLTNFLYIINDGVQVICNKAFQSQDLKCIQLPNTVIAIGELSFANNSDLESCNIPVSVKLIRQNNPWGGCYNIKNLDCKSPYFKIKNGILYSSDFAVAYGMVFWKSEIFLEPNTKHVAANAFWSNSHKDRAFIKKAILPHVITIGHHAFSHCEGLTDIVLPKSLAILDNGVFEGCENLKLITIPESVKMIGDEAFRECANLTSIIIPYSVESIGDEAFSGCDCIEELFIPKSVKHIGYSIFGGCEGNQRIMIEKGNPIYDSRENCNAIIETKSNKLISGCNNTIIPDTIQIIGKKAFDCCGFKTIVIPRSITIIEDEAFAYCFDLTTIIIPDSVKIIGNNIFECCIDLEKICIPYGSRENFEHLLPNYKDKLVEQEINIDCFSKVTNEDSENSWIDELGVMYSPDKTHLIKAPNDIANYSIREGTKFIDNGAFIHCNLKTIVVPAGVLLIGDLAFSDCFALEKVIISDTVEHIGNKAFFECYVLAEVSMSKSIKTIGNFAFEDCRLLQNIDLPKTLKYLGEGAFECCESLISIEIPDSITSVGKKVFCGCHSLSHVKLPDTITLIDEYAFETCNLSKIDIPLSLLEIKDFAFSGCPIKSINIPGSVTTIGNSVFLNCTELSEAHFSSTPISFGKEVFDLCTYLQKILIPLGTKDKFELLVPDYRDKLLEQVKGWIVKEIRSFSPEEIAAVKRAEVVASKYGNSICFFMQSGGQTHIPLCESSSLAVGDNFDLTTAKVITLCREGKDDIYRVIE